MTPDDFGQAVKQTARETGYLTAIVGLIVSRVLTRYHIELTTEDTMTVVSFLAAAIMYAVTHWQVGDIAPKLRLRFEELQAAASKTPNAEPTPTPDTIDSELDRMRELLAAARAVKTL